MINNTDIDLGYLLTLHDDGTDNDSSNKTNAITISTSRKRINLWDILSPELKDFIFQFTDPLTCQLNNRLSPGKTIFYSIEIWREAFRSDLNGNLHLLPSTRLPSIKNGLLLVKSRSMYEGLSKVMPDLTNFDLIKHDLASTHILGVDSKLGKDLYKALTPCAIHIAMRHCWMDEIEKFCKTALGHLNATAQRKALADIAMVFGHLNLFKHLMDTYKDEFTEPRYHEINVGQHLTLAATLQNDSNLFNELLQLGYKPDYSKPYIGWLAAWRQDASCIINEYIDKSDEYLFRGMVVIDITRVNLKRRGFATGDVDLWKRCCEIAKKHDRTLNVVLKISKMSDVDIFAECTGYIHESTVRRTMACVAAKGNAGLFKYLFQRACCDQPQELWRSYMCELIRDGLRAFEPGSWTDLMPRAIHFLHLNKVEACDPQWVSNLMMDENKLHIVEGFQKYCKCPGIIYK
ncbi:hypothetical protein HDU76_013631 [Blyttiomyces sp. JEL0837]|nr:hypothetical protein HDU76_013631 [Blyttiomyces sp. JEL0837]